MLYISTPQLFKAPRIFVSGNRPIQWKKTNQSFRIQINKNKICQGSKTCSTRINSFKNYLYVVTSRACNPYSCCIDQIRIYTVLMGMLGIQEFVQNLNSREEDTWRLFEGSEGTRTNLTKMKTARDCNTDTVPRI